MKEIDFAEVRTMNVVQKTSVFKFFWPENKFAGSAVDFADWLQDLLVDHFCDWSNEFRDGLYDFVTKGFDDGVIDGFCYGLSNRLCDFHSAVSDAEPGDGAQEEFACIGFWIHRDCGDTGVKHGTHDRADLINAFVQALTDLSRKRYVLGLQRVGVEPLGEFHRVFGRVDVVFSRNPLSVALVEILQTSNTLLNHIEIVQFDSASDKIIGVLNLGEVGFGRTLKLCHRHLDIRPNRGVTRRKSSYAILERDFGHQKERRKLCRLQGRQD